MTDVLDYEAEETDAPETEAPSGLSRLLQFAEARGDITELLTEQELANLGHDVVEDYRRDDASRADWKDKVEAALRHAAQEDDGEKSYPFPNASNVKYPILTVAAQQFAARAMPAIVKGDEAVGVKVIGQAPVPPALPQPPPGQQLPPEVAAQLQPIVQAFQQAQAQWQAKNARAKRVKTYLNYQIFYGMDDWEGDTDALLHQLPVVGCGFRKVYYDASDGRSCSEFVNALNLTVAMDTKSLKRAPRITQDFELYPYEIEQRQRRGIYRDVTLTQTEEDAQAPRKILEQHRLHDLDGDGVEEPYIVTVDEQSEQVLRIDAAFTPDDVTVENGEVVSIERWVPFVKYGFLPDPKGRFYDIGFGHLLKPLTEVLNTSINQLLDAGHAQVAGGGFIASGLRLQGAGRQSTLKWRPGEYKTVNMSGQDLRAAIYERPLPQPSPVLFQLLDLILGAAKDIAAIKDVITGEAPQNAPVGTTLALIEQGLQVFTSIYKRVYRAEREEFQLLYDCEAKFGNPADYAEIVDDPQADFRADFDHRGRDIIPVSDPSVVTKMQALAKAQVLGQVNQQYPGVLNQAEAAKRTLEAAEIDDADALISPPQPNPMVEAKVKETEASAASKQADALKKTVEAGQAFGELHGNAEQGGVPGLEGAPGDAMGAQGGAGGGAGPAPGVDAGFMGGGGSQPVAPGGAENPG
jgi:chaperonin GroES